MNRYFFIFIIILGISFVFWLYQKTKEDVIKEADNVLESNTIDLCFSKKFFNSNTKLSDEYNLIMHLNKNKVFGELNFLSTEKDKKTGSFVGKVSDVDKNTMSRTIDAIWDVLAEGKNTKEELKIIFGEGVANLVLVI